MLGWGIYVSQETALDSFINGLLWFVSDDDRLDSRLAPGFTDKKSWLGSDRDYTYDELLCRVFDIIREKNPDMVAGEKKKFVMRPPQVLKVGTRKSSFANFSDICRL